MRKATQLVRSQMAKTPVYKELKEITAVLTSMLITRESSRKSSACILTDLGWTFIKLGQIVSMRSDILPKRYCDELMKALL